MHKYTQHTDPNAIYPLTRERIANYALAFAIGCLLAVALVTWWSS